MSVQLRDYQEEAIAKLRGSLRNHRSVLLTVPTGGGKTVLAAFMAGSAAAKGLRVWFVCHRDFLIDQTSQTFAKVGIDHAFIAAGWTVQPHKKVQICSIDTLRNRLDRLTPPDLMILDEGQHACAGSWKKIAEWAGSSKIVGLSGSPCRLDGKGLGDVFDDLVMGPTMAWLMQHGHLSQYKAYAPSTPDLTGVHTRAGDYAAGELDAACNKQSLVGDIVRHYQVYARGLKAIYFGCSIAHSERIAATFRDAGIGAAHIDGTTPSAERKAAARALARGEISVISNCSLAFEGYDLAAQAGMDVSIDCVGLCRPTQSLSLHLQMLGRGLRPSAGKSHAVILDHAGGILKHGLPDDDREWSLEGQKKGKKKGAEDPAVPLIQCPRCFHCHRPAPKCAECGHVYVASAKKEVEEVEGELHEIDKEALRATRKAEEAKARTLEDLIKLGQERGYKNPVAWAGHRATARHAARNQRRAMPQAPEWA
jgi:DNA repair protein RadD